MPFSFAFWAFNHFKAREIGSVRLRFSHLAIPPASWAIFTIVSRASLTETALADIKFRQINIGCVFCQQRALPLAHWAIIPIE
jgi:hypothetical protein